MTVSKEAIDAALDAYFGEVWDILTFEGQRDERRAFRRALEAASPIILEESEESEKPEMGTNEKREWGIIGLETNGELRYLWEWGENPLDLIDSDGEIQLSKYEWIKVYQIMSRPVAKETIEWQSDDCPFKQEVTP